MSPHTTYGTWTDQAGRDHEAEVIGTSSDGQLVVLVDGQCPVPINPDDLHRR